MASRQSRGSRLQKLRARPQEEDEGEHEEGGHGTQGDGPPSFQRNGSHDPAAHDGWGTDTTHSTQSQGSMNGSQRAFPEPPELNPYIAKLERFKLYCTDLFYFIVAHNEHNSMYRVLRIDRTRIEWPPDAPSAKKAPHAGLKHSPNPRGGSPNRASASSQSQSSYDGGPKSKRSESQTIPEASHRAKPTMRPLSDFLTEDPHIYTREEIQKMIDPTGRSSSSSTSSGIGMGGRRNRRNKIGQSFDEETGLPEPVAKAYGIVGFIRFLDCYHLTLITRRAKVGSIGENGIYTIKDTETFPIKPSERVPGQGGFHDIHADPSSVLLSMWNRGKLSVGLGVSNPEMSELRYLQVYQVVELSKNFFFSYTYDLTRGLQQNFLASSSKPFPPLPFKNMYAWNYFLTRELKACTNSHSSFHWILPIVHGAFIQRKLNDYGRTLNVSLLARRSRHFAGTRYLKRGVSERGKVANDVEHEQIVHDESTGIYSSYLQVRGSIPTFWTQESSVTNPKPSIELNHVDLTYKATQIHFGDLMKRYGSPIVVLDLVKQSEKREREVRVGNEYRHAIDYINTSIDPKHKIQYCALDYSHISKHRHLDVRQSLKEVSTWSVNQTGFFCSAPKWKIVPGNRIEPFTSYDLEPSKMLSTHFDIPAFPMEQTGVLRTNCIDCLDRTNVAQFSAGVEAMEQQLVVMGVRSSVKLDPSSTIVRILIDMYVDIGDHIALQYGGSEAHKKVSAERSESNIAGPIGKHNELLTSIRRYYSNAFKDDLKQDAMNLFLGFYIPYMHTTPLWEMETDYYLHLGKKRYQTMKLFEQMYNVLSLDNNGDDMDDPQYYKDSQNLVSLRSNVHRSSSATSIQTSDAMSDRMHNVARQLHLVQQRCQSQKRELSSWWKIAIKSNVRQRLWMQLGEGPADSQLPPRYDRVYHPDKLSQFDRFFARAWATPVRAGHATQQGVPAEEEEQARYRRTFADPQTWKSQNASASPLHGPNLLSPMDGDTTVEQYLAFSSLESKSDGAPRFASDTVPPRDKMHYGSSNNGEGSGNGMSGQYSVTSGYNYLGQLGDHNKPVPEEYKRYVEPLAASSSNPFANTGAIYEFRDSLHDLSLHSNDVDGIRELAQSGYVGRIVSSGTYRGLNQNTSAIQVATAIQEQLDAAENMFRRGELRETNQVLEVELRRRGMLMPGVKASILNGRRRNAHSSKVYRDFLRPASVTCERSELTNDETLQLYATFSGPEETLKTEDLAFLIGERVQPPHRTRTSEVNDQHESASTDALAARRFGNEQSDFVARAARLGIPIASNAQIQGSKPPALFESAMRSSVPPGFEMINDDMYARKENKFVVFNGAGVDTWRGPVPMTKTTGIETMLMGTSDEKVLPRTSF